MSNKTEIRYLSPVDIEKRKQSKDCRFKKMGIKKHSIENSRKKVI